MLIVSTMECVIGSVWCESAEASSAPFQLPLLPDAVVARRRTSAILPRRAVLAARPFSAGLVGSGLVGASGASRRRGREKWCQKAAPGGTLKATEPLKLAWEWSRDRCCGHVIEMCTFSVCFVILCVYTRLRN